MSAVWQTAIVTQVRPNDRAEIKLSNNYRADLVDFFISENT